MEVWVPQLMISRWIDLLDKIIKYAASHGVRELFIRSPYGTWASVSGSVCASYQSLKVLELNQLNITKTDVELWSCLKLLESLTLANCRLPFGDGAHDALPNFPRLETLKLDRCFSLRTEFKARVLIVTGPELLNFEMVSSGFDYLEIDAPKLQSFGLMTDSPIIMLLDVSKSNLPSLSRANIDLVEHVHSALDTSSERDSKRKQHIERCVDLFKVLHNIEVLNLQVANLELLIQLGEPQFSP